MLGEPSIVSEESQERRSCAGQDFTEMLLTGPGTGQGRRSGGVESLSLAVGWIYGMTLELHCYWNSAWPPSRLGPLFMKDVQRQGLGLAWVWSLLEPPIVS